MNNRHWAFAMNTSSIRQPKYCRLKRVNFYQYHKETAMRSLYGFRLKDNPSTVACRGVTFINIYRGATTGSAD